MKILNFKGNIKKRKLYNIIRKYHILSMCYFLLVGYNYCNLNDVNYMSNNLKCLDSKISIIDNERSCNMV